MGFFNNDDSKRDTRLDLIEEDIKTLRSDIKWLHKQVFKNRERMDAEIENVISHKIFMQTIDDIEAYEKGKKTKVLMTKFEEAKQDAEKVKHDFNELWGGNNDEE